MEIDPVFAVSTGTLPSGRTQEIFSVSSTFDGSPRCEREAPPKQEEAIRGLHTGHYQGVPPHLRGSGRYHLQIKGLLAVLWFCDIESV